MTEEDAVHREQALRLTVFYYKYDGTAFRGA